MTNRVAIPVAGYLQSQEKYNTVRARFISVDDINSFVQGFTKSELHGELLCNLPIISDLRLGLASQGVLQETYINE